MKLLSEKGKRPKLAVIMVGNNPASAIYVRKKQEAAEEIGIEFQLIHLNEDASQEELLSSIQKLNKDEATTGIIVQLPIAEHMDKFEALNTIHPYKDIDGLSTINAGKTATEAKDALKPATPLGVMRILKWANVELKGKEAVVIGRSQLVGQPMSIMLAQENTTVTICHKETADITKHLKQADVIVSATGVPMLVKGEQVKKGCTIVDVGISPNINPNIKKKIVGDICESVDGIAAAVTPVPGGVGPMTVCSIITNIVDATYLQAGEQKAKWVIPSL